MSYERVFCCGQIMRLVNKTKNYPGHLFCDECANTHPNVPPITRASGNHQEIEQQTRPWQPEKPFLLVSFTLLIGVLTLVFERIFEAILP